MDVVDTVTSRFAGWWWIVALVVLFAVIYRVGAGRSSGGAGMGCLAAVLITLAFFLVVIF